jgi:hypothetical protein
MTMALTLELDQIAAILFIMVMGLVGCRRPCSIWERLKLTILRVADIGCYAPICLYLS